MLTLAFIAGRYDIYGTIYSFSARLSASRFALEGAGVPSGGPEKTPRPQCRPQRRFSLVRKRPDVIDSKWSGREDLNLRPPGPEPENSPFLKSGKIRNWKNGNAQVQQLLIQKRQNAAQDNRKRCNIPLSASHKAVWPLRNVLRSPLQKAELTKDWRSLLLWTRHQNRS